MIHIFNVCTAICQLPGMLCNACGEACKSCPGACKACCDPLRYCCTSIGTAFKHFHERPLSSYVVVSVLVSGATLYLSYDGLNSIEGCSSNFLYILMGFSIVNMLFAWFLQSQVWKQIMSHDRDFIDGDNGEQPGKYSVPKDIVQGAFRKVFMEDFVVLGMFILLICLFILSWKGQQFVDRTEPRCLVGFAEYCGYAFFWIAFAFASTYYCCRCCSGSVVIKKDVEQLVDSGDME